MIYIAAAILVLLILSAFFSGSETALTAASRPLMHQLEKDGNARAGLINRLQMQKERVIGSILLGNNLVNILASALATSMFMSIYGEAGVAIATVSMTLLVLIFAEILPKTYAIRHANRAALGVVPIINVLVIVLLPFVKAINFIVRLLLRLFGVDLHATDPGHSSTEELRGAIELHSTVAEGEDRESTVLLRSVMDLMDVQVREIMTHRKDLDTINADTSVQDTINQVLESAYTRLPVWRDDADNMVGILHAKALLREVRSHGGDTTKLDGLDITTIAATPWFIPNKRRCLNSCRRSVTATSTLPWWWTNTACCKASSRWKTSWKKSSATLPMKPTFRWRAYTSTPTARLRCKATSPSAT